MQIGALLYVAVNTRPDIAVSVTILSQHNKDPTLIDWTEAKRITCYLKGTIDVKLKLRGQDAVKRLIGFAEANWAADKSDRKSNSDYLFQLYGASISWACRKQTCVALSSTEVEYVALVEACQEGVWVRRLLEDMKQKQQGPTVVYEDNQSCLQLICNKKFSHRTKHIDTKYHYIKDLKDQGIMEYKYCPKNQMPADLLTKPLNGNKLRFMLKMCGLSHQ
ncbi:secreted RxLR effector protein 161-like [Belonocnema kinseyi]|uniref:secreted RxLR effector protein 161-like n=1 Tax=Belonocnema kinseyi TaxID=2817044 RepID=UPI00143D8387|nr:secreted RxLR effector protein 161-like [Belonocnema kinseyi]